MNTGYAFGLGDLTSMIGLNKNDAVAVDSESLNNRQAQMFLKLWSATKLYALANHNIKVALELDPESLAEEEMVISNLDEDRTNEDYVRAAVSMPTHAEEVKAKLKELLDSGDQERIESINEAIRAAELKKAAAQIITILAIKDAVGIVKDGICGLRGGADNEAFNRLIQSAKVAQKFCDQQSKQTKEIDGAMKEYKKKQNIKPIPKNEALALSESWQKEWAKS